MTGVVIPGPLVNKANRYEIHVHPSLWANS